MPNRLASETSPYLLQHKDNPVDWYPWGEEAFEKARIEDKPIFLSVGYSSCHWCHVMEHESFEDVGVAQVLNEHFVAVKVDREERPDVDETYMAAVQLSSGRGGWPMSVFLTPDRKPFFAGTYFPRDDRGQHPGFVRILTQIANVWKAQRGDVEKQGDEFASALRETMGRSAPESSIPLDEEFLANAVKALAADFDDQNAGFGGAPKFPPHTTIEFLLSYTLRPSAPRDIRELALGMALATLERMALGGIHDHVGGGFHRYSTDGEWLLPHFEKMLYDNALMLGNYSRAAAICHELDEGLESLFARTAAGVANWALREMRSREGLFYSALDADSEGEEGKFYVWTEQKVKEVLGDRAADFLAAYRCQASGNFEDEATGQRTGANIPHLSEYPGTQFDNELAALRAAREDRVRPGLDDKALVGWNGLMIQALAESGVVAFAEAAAEAILQAEGAYGSLPHQIAGGKPSGKAYLEDYAAFACALFTLARVKEILRAEAPTGRDPGQWRAEGKRLALEMAEKFVAPDGSFFGTSADHEELFGRTRPVFDSPAPSGNGLALKCLIEIGEMEAAAKCMQSLIGWMERAPGATEALYSAALLLVPAGETEAVQPIVAPAPEVRVRLEQKEIVAGPDGKGSGAVVLDIPEGLHVNSHQPPARWLTPTKLEFHGVKAEVQYPAPVDEGYDGTVRIPFTIIPKGKGAEEFEVKVSYQACTESECLLPSERTFSGVLLPG